MPGIMFEDETTPAASAPNRMDIALFAGFVRRSKSALPAGLFGWLNQRGWVEGPYARPVNELEDLPVPLESWQQFETLFEWRDRTGTGTDGDAYLGAAVRSFFAQGGRRCYVVRVGDPWALDAARNDRLAALAKLIPGYPWGFLPSPADRSSWHGVGHLFGLRDVSFVVMPDLAQAIATDRGRVEVPKPLPSPPEQFVVCTPPAPAPPMDRTVRGVGAPRCDAQGFHDWAAALALVTGALARYAREAEVVAAVPLPDADLAFDRAPATAFLQLAYPWVRTPGSDGLPEQLEPADGALTGMLARKALTDGTYSSAAGLHTADLFDAFPILDREQQETNRLIERVSLIGPTPSGLRLLSDVTMSADESYRPGSTSRLIATIVRTARRIGEEVVFDSSGPRLWGEIRYRLDAMMRGLYHAGAFEGASPDEAYQVRCDRATMTQNDHDNGRVVATVQFTAAAPVDTITVVLILNEGGQAAAIESEAA
jgi:hypothetical protein